MANTNECPVLTDVTDGIATITLNKPWKLNAWDTPMRAEIAKVLHCWNGDQRVRAGHPGVRMGQAEINSGIPSVTGPMLMLPRIGLSRTVELTLTGRMMDAEECRAIGLIHYLVPRPEQVVPKTREVADLMAAKPAIAMRLSKARLRQVTQPAFDEAFENGGVYQSEAFASGEPQAAMRIFFGERAARRKAREAARGKG